ncbi:MAG: DUF1641 domain-containing protein [Myxococcota bacterium]
MSTIEERLDGVERSLKRVEALLSVQLSTPNGTHANGTHANGTGNGHGSGTLFGLAARQASQQLASVDGEEPVRERITEAMVRLGDPDTLGALTRLAEVAPSLEYAVHALAAGPELLDELTHNLDDWARAHGLDDGGRARMEAGQRALMVLSQPATMRSVERVAQAAPSLAPAVDGLAQGLGDLVAHEGEAAFRARVAETVVQIAEPEALDALARILTLAPKLEYAVHFLAAGPELLEEAFDELKARTGDSHEAQRRLTDATETLATLSEPGTQRALRGVVRALPPLAPALDAASRALGRVGEVHGDATRDSIEEVVLRLAEPETLEALGNLLVLLPKLEYLAHVGAAGPELLEEALDVVRDKTGEVPTAALGQAGGELLAALMSPDVLRALSGLARGIAGPQGTKLLRRLDSEALVNLVGSVDFDAVETLVRYAKPVAHIAEEIPWGSLEAYLDLVKKPEITLGLHRLLELAPSLVAPLEALPVQTRTLHLLASVNEAIEAAAENPPRKGAFGVLGALRDPDVQAALGVALEVARRAGAALRQGPPKELTAGE